MGPLSKNEQACNVLKSRNVVILSIHGWMAAQDSVKVSGSSGNNL